MEMLEMEDLTLSRRRMLPGWFRHGEEDEMLLENITLTLHRGRSLGLVGADKNALLAFTLALLKLHPVRSGKIILSGVDVTLFTDRQFRAMRRRIQAVFPDRFGQLTAELTVSQSFREVLKIWYPGEGKDEWSRRIEAVMIACNLPEAVRDLYPVELDAVERQQVALARALLPGPDLLICHGLTEGLDAVQQAELLNGIRQIREDFRLTLLVVTDDLAVAHHLGDDIAVVHRGALVEAGSAETVVNRPEHDYTRRLISCTV